ncbi:hypothetical protein N9P29_00980 [bacterium]|nr:hypothetical protein [bacterium]
MDMTDPERNVLIYDCDEALVKAIDELSLAHSFATEAEADRLAHDISKAVKMIEQAINLILPPSPTHYACPVAQDIDASLLWLPHPSATASGAERARAKSDAVRVFIAFSLCL